MRPRRQFACLLATLSLLPGIPVQAQGSPSPAVVVPSQSVDQDSPELSKLRSQLQRAQKTLKDWAAVSRYQVVNAQLSSPGSSESRVVFLGDSITDNWGRKYGNFFPGKPYINRGIGGQTTPQMLIRFRPDVIALQPKAVVILAGTNDIAGNTGPMTVDAIEGNLTSMAELAKANGLRVVFASILPVCDSLSRQTERRPPEKIEALNAWMKGYAAKNRLVYLDYFSAMVDDNKMLKSELTYDCLHPNAAGYEIMAPLAEKAISRALGTRPVSQFKSREKLGLK